MRRIKGRLAREHPLARAPEGRIPGTAPTRIGPGVEDGGFDLFLREHGPGVTDGVDAVAVRAALPRRPASMIRCTCLSGTPVTQAASLADNIRGTVVAVMNLSSFVE